jgi:hypothetical protein
MPVLLLNTCSIMNFASQMKRDMRTCMKSFRRLFAFLDKNGWRLKIGNHNHMSDIGMIRESSVLLARASVVESLFFGMISCNNVLKLKTPNRLTSTGDHHHKPCPHSQTNQNPPKPYHSIGLVHIACCNCQSSVFCRGTVPHVVKSLSV